MVPKDKFLPPPLVICLQSGWNQLYLKRYGNIFPAINKYAFSSKKKKKKKYKQTTNMDWVFGFHKNWMPTM